MATPKRGGRRPGAGRPPAEPTKQISARLTLAEIAALEQIAPSAAAAIRKLLERHMRGDS